MIAPKKVMIVDDEPDPLKAMQEFKDNSQEYALVISDIKMPGMDGFEFARNVKEVRGNMPLVLMTAFEIDESEFSSLLPPNAVAELFKKPVFNRAADRHC